MASVFSISTHVSFKFRWGCVKNHTWFGDGEQKVQVSLPHPSLYHILQSHKYAFSEAHSQNTWSHGKSQKPTGKLTARQIFAFDSIKDNFMFWKKMIRTDL